jgi:nitroreductase
LDFENMPTLDALIKQRRSIRKYRDEVPPADLIEAAIRCGAMAPSPSNLQPVRFIRINSPDVRRRLHQSLVAGHADLLDQLAKAADGPKRLKNWINTYRRYSEFMVSAPVLLALATVKAAAGFARKLLQAGILPRGTRGEADLDLTVGLALSGLILKVQELGLGSCVLTAPLVFIADAEAVLGLEDVALKCFVTVGFPDEAPAGPGRKPMSEIYREI